MIYRKAEYSDLAELQRLYQQLVPEDAIPDFQTEAAIAEVWERIQGRQEYAYFVAEETGTLESVLCGSCNITIIPNLTHGGRPFGVIENVIIDSVCRGQGIGKNLITMAVEYARQANCYKVQLLSGSERTGAHQFYERLGFSGSSKKGFDMRL